MFISDSIEGIDILRKELPDKLQYWHKFGNITELHYRHVFDDKYFDEFKGFPMIKDSIGFFKAHVVKTRNKKRENDYNDGIGNIVTCEVDDIYISDYKEIVPLNRAMNAVIESLIYYCRFDHKYSHMQKEIWTHMKELNRVCHKVGNESEKKSMELILAKMKETHDYLE